MSPCKYDNIYNEKNIKNYKDVTKKYWILPYKCGNIYNEKSIKIIKMPQKSIECHIVMW